MKTKGSLAWTFPLRKQFDTSGKSPARFHHRAICKTVFTSRNARPEIRRITGRRPRGVVFCVSKRPDADLGDAALSDRREGEVATRFRIELSELDVHSLWLYLLSRAPFGSVVSEALRYRYCFSGSVNCGTFALVYLVKLSHWGGTDEEKHSPELECGWRYTAF